MGRFFRLMVLSVPLLLPASAALAASFSQPGPLRSDAGYFLVEWQASGPVELEIKAHGDGRAARALYGGANRALFISGLPDGQYTLRLRKAGSTGADTLELIVAHQSLRDALWLVALGALAFLATVAVIVRGARDE